jgi:hypothetical protein
MSGEHDIDHGHTVAAWTAVILMMIGSTIAGLAFWFTSATLFWVGIAVVVLGGIAGKVLQVMGLGQQKAAA